MSDTCGNCSCADRSQCVKKGDQYSAEITETEHSDFIMPEDAETGCNCKIGGTCTCTNCTCH